MLFNLLKSLNYSLIVFLLLTILFLTHFMPMGWNDSSRLATVQSLVEHHSYKIDNTESFFRYTGDKVFINNHFYSDKPLMHASIASLPYFVLHFIGINFTYHPRVIIYLTTVFISLLPFLLFFFLLYKWSDNKWLNKNENIKLFLIFNLAVGTILLPYTTVVNNHITSATLVGISLLFLYYKKFNKLNLFWIGLLLSLGTVMDPGVIFILGWFGLYVLWRIFGCHSEHSDSGVNNLSIFKRILIKRSSVSLKIIIPLISFFILGIIIPFFIHALITISITGDLFPGSMHSEFFNYAHSPFDSQNLTGVGLAVTSFKDWAKYVFAMLFSQMRGFVLHNPILWLGLPLLCYLSLRGTKRPRLSCVSINSKRDCFVPHNDRLFSLASILSIIFIILYYSLFGKDFGGPNYSIRWFIIFIPIVLVAIYNWVDNWKKYLIVVVLCLLALAPNISATSKVFNYANSGSTDKRLFIRAMQNLPVYAGQQAEEWIKLVKSRDKDIER